MRTIKRMAALLLVLVLVLSCLPAASVFAAEPPEETVPAAADATDPPPAVSEPDVTAETQPAPTGPAETTAATMPETTAASPEAALPLDGAPAEDAADPTEEATEATDPTDKSDNGEAGTVTLKSAAGSAILSLKAAPEGADDPVFSASEMELAYEDLAALLTQEGIPNILGLYSAQLYVTGVSALIDLSIAFDNPIPVLDENNVYVFLIHDGIAEQIMLPYVSIVDNGITEVFTPLSISEESFQIVILTSDQPGSLVQTGQIGWIFQGSGNSKDTYGSGPAATNPISGIGASGNGMLNFHCWQPPGGNHTAVEPTDFVICLAPERKWYWDGMVYEEVNATNVLGSCAPDNASDVWRRLSQTTRNRLMLLLFYGMDTDSQYHKLTPSDLNDAKSMFTAMQLIAWEWIKGQSDGAYTSHYSSSVQNYARQLRDYVYNNPDNIDTSANAIYLLSHTKRYTDGAGPGKFGYGQPMIAVGPPPVSSELPITIQKSINASPECIAQLTDNAMYSLEGAKYDVVIDGEVVETLITDANGNTTTTKKFKPGTTGTVVETQAPPGFRLDSTPVEFTVPSSGECIVKVSDVPIMDPPFAITKVDKDTTTPQGDGSFSGAVFKWEYFDNTTWSGSAKRTWYFQTDAGGWVYYEPSYMATDYTSDELYCGRSGAYEILLGTVKITEIRNSLGYIVIQKPLYCSIVQQGETETNAKIVWTPESWDVLLDMASGNFGVYEPIDPDSFGSLTIQKKDKNFGTTAPTWATLAGCEFTVYNRSANPVKIGENEIAQPGDACIVLTADETGIAATGNIFPAGTYEVRETKGNDYYQCNEEWSYTFTVTGTENNPVFITDCADTMRPAALHLSKADTGGNPLPGSKFCLEWSADGDVWQPVTKADDIVMGGCMSPELDENGCLTIGGDGILSFTGLYPVVYYRITEVEAPNGYQLLKDPILVETLLPENNFENSFRVVNSDIFTLPKTGSAGFWMIVPCFCLGGAAMIFGTFAGIKKREDG